MALAFPRRFYLCKSEERGKIFFTHREVISHAVSLNESREMSVLMKHNENRMQTRNARAIYSVLVLHIWFH